MTIDDLACKIRAEQGYLVMCSYDNFEVGAIIREVHGHRGKGDRINIPLIVVGLSNRKEYLKQADLRDSIVGRPSGRSKPPGERYYRVEAAD